MRYFYMFICKIPFLHSSWNSVITYIGILVINVFVKNIINFWDISVELMTQLNHGNNQNSHNTLIVYRTI